MTRRENHVSIGEASVRHPHKDPQDTGRPADLSVSLFIIGLAIEDHKRAGGNPIDHSRNTHERGHRGDQIGDCPRHAGQERSAQEPDATEKRYPGSSVPSSYPVSG